MELTSEKSCCSAGNNQVDEQAGITQARFSLPEEGMATYSSVLAWRIPWTEGPGGLQLMGLQSDTTHTLHW